MGNGCRKILLINWRECSNIYLVIVSLVLTRNHSEMNIIAMRLGPGKHLQGRVLMGGIVKPEEFDYFHEVRF